MALCQHEENQFLVPSDSQDVLQNLTSTTALSAVEVSAETPSCAHSVRKKVQWHQ